MSFSRFYCWSLCKESLRTFMRLFSPFSFFLITTILRALSFLVRKKSFVKQIFFSGLVAKQKAILPSIQNFSLFFFWIMLICSSCFYQSAWSVMLLVKAIGHAFFGFFLSKYCGSGADPKNNLTCGTIYLYLYILIIN